MLGFKRERIPARERLEQINGKEISMLDNKSENLSGEIQDQKEHLKDHLNEQELISLESLADLTGFPVEMIRTELFNSELTEEKVTLNELRAAMVNYIDATMLDGADQ